MNIHLLSPTTPWDLEANLRMAAKPALNTSDDLLLCTGCAAQYEKRGGEGLEECRICEVCLSPFREYLGSGSPLVWDCYVS